mgnify:CR=1 FL=1
MTMTQILHVRLSPPAATTKAKGAAAAAAESEDDTPMGTTEVPLTEEEIAIFDLYATDIMEEEEEEELSLYGAAIPGAGAGDGWVRVGRGGGGSGGGGELPLSHGTGLDFPYTPMDRTSTCDEDLDSSMRGWGGLSGSTSLSSSSSSSSSKLKVLKVGTLVSVFEGTKGGIRGQRAISYMAKVVSYISGLSGDGIYEVKPIVEFKKVRRVPAYSVQEQQAFMSPASQRSRYQMTSQQKREKVKNHRDRTILVAALKKEKKERAQLMRKYHMVVEDNKTLEAERAALLACLGKKGPAPTRAMEKLIRPIINVARQNLAVDMDGLEKESVRLRRHVSHKREGS